MTGAEMLQRPPEADADAVVLPERTSGARHHVRTMAGLAVSVVALGAVIWWATKQETPTFPSSPRHLALLGVAVLVHIGATLARGWRWHVVLRSAGVQHDAIDAYALTTVGYMGNTVLPARGGEVLRTVLLGQRSSARKREILGSIVAERLLDVAALAVLFVVVTFGGVAGAPVGLAPAIASMVAALLAGVGLVVYLRGRRAGRWTAFADRIRPFVLSVRAMLGATGLLLLLVSSAIWLSEGVIFFLVGRSLELAISLPEAAFLVVIGSFFALIPAAPGYVGTYDAAVLFGLKALGISGGASIGFTILVRFVLFVPVTVVGLLFMLFRYGGLARVAGRLRLARRGPSPQTTSTKDPIS
ncbi:flippase-like domain-containing protein [Paraconexibacter antarcticus]|uniref:Flippase-like domain-containing protein n=1 Tax=Paraconexibacter antarcticus TaxID=2949664 RepID=A0ABY5DW20_9ACTN|nr:lysylphosphatidylglycerol synthase transmembrane domain-containing protein [Paraconexibacter antarcticus]UTI65057.1 flippase-like domain-containing protein [Paraconexibacter antarcticus]